jgi:hypothetical protein
MMQGVRLHVYTVCWNEEKILPHFLRHYSKFAEKIVVYDNYSTDSSPDIVKSFNGVEIRRFYTGGYFDDRENIKIKNTAYKESIGKADYVIVVDSDEFLYYQDIITLLSKYRKEGVTLPRTIGYDMVSWLFPNDTSPITETVRLGMKSLNYSKRIIFDPKIEINFAPGCHTCNPLGDIVESKFEDIKVLHYHYIGLVQNISKHRAYKKRLSKFNIKSKLGYQFTWGPIRLLGRFIVYRLNSHDIIRQVPSAISKIFSPSANFLKRRLTESDDRDKRWHL